MLLHEVLLVYKQETEVGYLDLMEEVEIPVVL
jgi:hypothetical protein